MQDCNCTPALAAHSFLSANYRRESCNKSFCTLLFLILIWVDLDPLNPVSHCQAKIPMGDQDAYTYSGIAGVLFWKRSMEYQKVNSHPATPKGYAVG